MNIPPRSACDIETAQLGMLHTYMIVAGLVSDLSLKEQNRGSNFFLEEGRAQAAHMILQDLAVKFNVIPGKFVLRETVGGALEFHIILLILV